MKKAEEYQQAYKKGMASWEKREPDRAVAELRKAAKIDDRDPELWLMIGRCELVLRQADRALEAWEQALKREPEYMPARFERGKLALGRHVAGRLPPPVDKTTGWLPLGLEAGRAEESQRILADLRAGAPHSREFGRFAAGAIYLLDGRYVDAQQNLQVYSDANGWDVGAIALVGVAGHFGGLSNRAEQTLSQALAVDKDPLWYKLRAETRYLQANYEGARADYREAGVEKEAEPLFARKIPNQGLILWLKADAGVETTGSSVSKWLDQSDAKNHAATKDPEVGPQVTASAVRGRPALLFAGKEDELRLPDGFEDFSGGLSMFVVGDQPTEPADPAAYLFLATPATGAGRVEDFIGRRKDMPEIVYQAEDIQVQTKPYLVITPPAKGFELFSAIHEPSKTVRVYKRGQQVATGTLLLPRKTFRTRNRVGAGLKGHVAEILLYKKPLSELERLGVEAYFKDRYFPDAAVPSSTEKR